jgi:demethylmenaquinone methyltransferase/2-methoxy-6-polyprenyl-1,4-benzoquinol methylase
VSTSEQLRVTNQQVNTEKARFFDAQAQADWAAPDYTPQERAKIAEVFHALPSLVGQTVLEPGCGTGRLTRILAERVCPQGRVLAMDISPQMVQMARAKVGGLSNVHLRCASMESCVLPWGEVDLVFCHQVFPHFDNKERAAEIIARCLCPGGVLVILHLISSREINDLHRKAGTAVAVDMMPEPAEMRRILEQAGMTVEQLNDAEDRYVLMARK